MRDRQSVAQSIDAGVDLAGSVGAGYVAFLAVASVPWLFGLATAAARALELKADAANFAPYWVEVCGILAGFYVLRVFAQLVFVRAAHSTLDCGQAPVGPTLKSALLATPSVLCVAALMEALCFLTAVSVVVPYFLWAASGAVLAAPARPGRPSLREAWRALPGKDGRAVRAVGLHALTLLIGTVVFVNLAALSQTLPALLGLIPGFEVERLLASFSLTEPRVGLGLWACAAAAIDPIRLGAMTVLAFEETSLTSGRDLRARLLLLVPRELDA